MLNNSVKVMEPSFVRSFKCAGETCPDHCCHSWKVTVNKKSYKELKKSSNIIIRQLANDNMELTRTSVENYAHIKMDDNNNCPFLDENTLCNIHKNCGHQALPHTCQEYPRAFNFFGDQVEASMIMSCPTVTNEVLFNTEAFMFESSSKLITDLNNGKIGGLPEDNLPVWFPTIRDFCFNIMLSEGLSFNERLFIMGMYLKQAEPHLNNPAKLAQMINSYISMSEDNTLQNMYKNLPAIPALKWHIFQHQDNKFVATTGVKLITDEKDNKNYTVSNSDLRFLACREHLLSALRDDKDEKNNKKHSKTDDNNTGEMFDKMLAQANNSLLPEYFDKNPHILVNYILYYLYHHQFLLKEHKTPFQFYRIMLVDYFMLTSYLSGIAVNLGELTDEWLAQLFQSYSRRSQHRINFIEGIEEQLKSAGSESDAAIFSLLK
ncbi:flagellin lysine-N-methylase [Colwellia sp. E2M01]|uniref:flagellin lysine-N-methylase n=1 Tax=Colwellia sp. E2M01 TaxID=2841561 RepID=UPI001C09B9DC|nr:flagellin lysine-N-methylase [Colwellia sp. E2M01]MBU2869966.1 flagellin lysine-N-methylase [Colwellia sp. E2M01]